MYSVPIAPESLETSFFFLPCEGTTVLASPRLYPPPLFLPSFIMLNFTNPVFKIYTQTKHGQDIEAAMLALIYRRGQIARRAYKFCCNSKTYFINSLWVSGGCQYGNAKIMERLQASGFESGLRVSSLD